MSIALLTAMSFNLQAATIAPTSMSASAGDLDGVVKNLLKQNDGASVAIYSNNKAKITAVFKFNTKNLNGPLSLNVALKQTTAKDVFTFYAVDTNGINLELGKTSGSGPNKIINLPIPKSAIKNNTVKIRLTSKASDDMILDYMVISNGENIVVPPPIITPPVVVAPPVPPSPPVVTNPEISAVPAGMSFHLQLQGTVKLDTPAKLYDIDLYDTTESSITELKNQGKIVICYFSAGSYEDWRIDAALFPKAALGNNLEGWPGEKWIDTRNTSVRKIMSDRISLAKAKGCDGIDPDNVDGYTNKPGFPLTITDQIDFNKFLAKDAHSKGLLIGLKNATDQVTALVDHFDFSVVEQCNVYKECERYSPFINQNKAVFVAEYTKYSAKVCDASRSLNFTTTFFNLALDGKLIQPCP